jgi:hypothetical protein
MAESPFRCEIKVHKWVYRGQFDSDEISFVVTGEGETEQDAVVVALSQVHALRSWAQMTGLCPCEHMALVNETATEES